LARFLVLPLPLISSTDVLGGAVARLIVPDNAVHSCRLVVYPSLESSSFPSLYQYSFLILAESSSSLAFNVGLLASDSLLGGLSLGGSPNPPLCELLSHWPTPLEGKTKGLGRGAEIVLFSVKERLSKDIMHIPGMVRTLYQAIK
jgi:hypothetical protein